MWPYLTRIRTTAWTRADREVLYQATHDPINLIPSGYGKLPAHLVLNMEGIEIDQDADMMSDYFRLYNISPIPIMHYSEGGAPVDWDRKVAIGQTCDGSDAILVLSSTKRETKLRHWIEQTAVGLNIPCESIVVHKSTLLEGIETQFLQFAKRLPHVRALTLVCLHTERDAVQVTNAAIRLLYTMRSLPCPSTALLSAEAKPTATGNQSFITAYFNAT